MLKLDKKAIGARVRLLRRARDLRQWQVAERIGTTQPAVHMYEQGVLPEPSRLLALARLGGTTVEWILTGRHADGSERMERPRASALDLARRFERFGAEDRRALEAALDTIEAAAEAIRSRAGRRAADLPVETLARRLRGFERETRALLASALEVHREISRRVLRGWAAAHSARGGRRAAAPERTA